MIDPETGGGAPQREYADARDDEQFWEALRLEREPLKQRWYIPAILLLVLFSVPWYFSTGQIGTIVGGLPVWVWIGLASAFGLSCATAAAVLWFWVDPGDRD